MDNHLKTSLIIIIVIITWIIYFFTFCEKIGIFLTNRKLIEVPYSVKCFFGEDKCEEGDINGWSLVNLILYFIIGVTLPGQYLLIIILAIVFEFLKQYVGYQSTYIIGPLIKITGYSLGSLLAPRKKFKRY